jgi:DNA-binding MarR family transcriptional regulator
LLGAEPPAVVLALDRLESGGSLTRQASLEDRRLRTLRLTAAGKKLLRKVTAQVDQQEARLKQAAGRNLPALVAALDDMMKLYGLR